MPDVRLTCPRCAGPCGRDEVHNGVAMLYGPWGCVCGWSESDYYDGTGGPKQVGGYQLDQRGGMTPLAAGGRRREETHA